MLPFGDRGHPRFKPAGFLAIASAGFLCSACAVNSDLQIGRSSATLAEKTPESSKNDITANLSELDKAIVYWGQKSAQTPSDRTAVLNYVRNLKAAGRSQQALAVLQQASFHHGTDREFAGEYGRLALSLDQASLAEKMLKAADDPSKPDWKIISAIGTAMAKQGRYNEAIPHYERAAKVAPNEPTLLNNLAMAYVASGRASDAEPLLQRAAGKPNASEMVKKNLELVLNLQGKASAPAPDAASALRGPTAPANRPSGWTTTSVARAD